MSTDATAPQTAPDPDDAQARLDYAVLTEQAEALRRAGRVEAADQLLAWRDLHAMRGPRRDGGV